MSNTEIKDAIRKVLAGSSMRCPVMMSDLLKIGSGAVDALEQMEDVGEIVCETLDGRPVFWFAAPAAGFPSAPIAFQYPPTPPRQPKPQVTAAIVKSITSLPSNHQETAMNNESATSRISPITRAVLDLVEEKPGISKEALKEAALKIVPTATSKQADKSIHNLLHGSKRICTRIIDNDRFYYPNKGAPVRPGKPIPKKQSKPAVNLIPEAFFKEQAEEAKRFSVVLDESNCVHIKIGDVTTVLNPDHADRVYRFIGRIHTALEGDNA